MTRRLLLAAAMVAALVLPASQAHADGDATAARERSRAAFRRGVSQAEAGDYRSARDSFLEAYRIFAHPSILLNLGIARAHTSEWIEAEQDLVHFLADDGGAQPDELASARAELAQARRHLGTFRLRVAPAGARATLDTRPLAVLPGSFVDVRTTRGSHDLHVAASGFTAIDRVVELDGERGADLDLSLTAGAAAPESPSLDGRQVAGWFMVGGGVVGIGAGVVLGVQALSLANAYNTPGSGRFQDASTKSSGETFRIAADVVLVGSLALAGVGTYLLLTSPTPSGAQAGVVVGPWSGVSGTF